MLRLFTVLFFTISAFSFCDTEIHSKIERALASDIKSLRASDEKSQSVYNDGEDYIATLKDGREIGIIVKIHEWDLAQSPYFWFADAQDPTFDGVLEPAEKGFRLEKVPKAWMASEYRTQGKTTREPSLIAGNAPRQVEKKSENVYHLDSGFVFNRSLMVSSVNLLMLVHNVKSGKVVAANLGINYCPDEHKARSLLARLTRIIPRPN